MAKPLFKLTYRKNISFNKLKKKVPKVIEQTLAKIVRESVAITRENIDKGLKPKLAPFTKIMRDKGYGWSGKKVGASMPGYKPLKQTGRLYRSIQYNKENDSMSIMAYGLIQNNGFISLLKKRASGYAHKNLFPGSAGMSKEKTSIKYIKVPPRPFIANTTQKKHRSRLMKIKRNHGKRFRKALRLKGGLKSFKGIFGGR